MITTSEPGIITLKVECVAIQINRLQYLNMCKNYKYYLPTKVIVKGSPVIIDSDPVIFTKI